MSVLHVFALGNVISNVISRWFKATNPQNFPPAAVNYLPNFGKINYLPNLSSKFPKAYLPNLDDYLPKNLHFFLEDISSKKKYLTNLSYQFPKADLTNW